jgi:hypothetical protein
LHKAERILPENTNFENFEIEPEIPGIGKRKMMMNARRMSGEPGTPPYILLAMEDVTTRNMPTEALSPHRWARKGP